MQPIQLLLTVFVSVALLQAAATSAQTAPSQPDPALLKQKIVTAIAAAVPEARFEDVDALSFRVDNGSGAGGQINIDRLYAFCSHSSAAECDAQAARFAAGMAEMLAGSDQTLTRPRLRVLVRNKDYVDSMARQLAAAGSGVVVADPLVADLDVVLGADFPTMTRLVTDADLRTLGLSRADALALAEKQTLDELIPDVGELGPDPRLIAGHDYGASLLLASAEWRSVAAGAKGILWIAVPADEHVLVGVVPGEADLARLKDLVRDQFSAAPRSISPLVFRWTSKGWVAVP